MATSLSFHEGRPIGIINKGKHKNKLIGIVEGKPKQENKIPHKFSNDFFKSLDRKKYGRITALVKEKLKQHVKKGIEPVDEPLKSIYEEAVKYYKDGEGKTVEITDGEIEPVPHPTKRECLYVAGPSGSGKSTYVSKYAKNFKKMFPDKEIILFSKVGDDECLDKLDPYRINITEDLIDEPIGAEELKDSLVIFDDTDTIANKKLRDAITALKEDILETGRHYNTYCIITSHLINNYKETRKVLNECHSITMFPSSGSAHPIRYCLKNNVGMSKKDIDKVFKVPSRWVTAFKHYPQCVMYSCGAYLLSQ